MNKSKILQKCKKMCISVSRYTSRFRATVVQEKKSGKDAMKTMGPAMVEMPSPDKYLQKNSRDHKLADSEWEDVVLVSYSVHQS